MPTCPKCGHINAGGKFCIKCGTRLSASSPEISRHETSKDTVLPASATQPMSVTPEPKSQPSVGHDQRPPSSATGGVTPTSVAMPFDTRKLVLIAGAAVVVVLVGVVLFPRLTKSPQQEAAHMENPSRMSTEHGVTPAAEPTTSDTRSVQLVAPESWRISAGELFALDGSPRSAAIAQLISDLESPYGEGMPFTKQELLDLLSRPEAQEVYYDKILKYATPVSLEIQKKEHEDYTKIFMKESYQKAGLDFLRTQREYLDRAEQEYGVLRRDIVSVLIWESGLGKFTGDFREFNVFLGLILFLDRAQNAAVQKLVAEGKPNPLSNPAHAEKERKRLDNRKAESVRNLVALLRLSKQIGADPLGITGSWGGAIGYVQFMPSNLKYAVDGDGDGKVNLSSWPDAIMSVAYYLKTLGNYESTDAGRRRALFRYNPSKEYVDGVKLVAETIWRRHLNGE